MGSLEILDIFCNVGWLIVGVRSGEEYLLWYFDGEVRIFIYWVGSLNLDIFK